MHPVRVLLLCEPSLLCDGVMQILRQTPRTDLVGPWPIDDQVLGKVLETHPHVILLIESEGDSEEVVHLTS